MVEIVISDYISPHCDFDFKDSRPIFPHDTPACTDMPGENARLSGTILYHRGGVKQIVGKGQAPCPQGVGVQQTVQTGHPMLSTASPVLWDFGETLGISREEFDLLVLNRHSYTNEK